MSLNRYAKRTDASQAAIIRVLEQAHVAVWVINWPCDLLTHHQGRWQPLEVKAGKRKRSDQKAQGDFLKTHGVPIVTTPTEALIALSILPCPALKDRVL